MPSGNTRSYDHEEAQHDPMDIYQTCYSISPDILADVYSATKGALSLWSGELRTMPRVYREAIIDHMFIFADGSKINKLVFALKDQSLDYGKE